MEPKLNSIKVGEDIILHCEVDNYYSTGAFRHDNKICKFEWNEREWNRSTSDCKGIY